MSKSCQKPKCPYSSKNNAINCICHKPFHIAVPAGEHMHLDCPVHGDIIICGPMVYMKTYVPGKMIDSPNMILDGPGTMIDGPSTQFKFGLAKGW